MDDWLDDDVEPWPQQQRRVMRRSGRIGRRAKLNKHRRAQPIRFLQDDRAANYCFYRCSTCDDDNSCCKCPDPRPAIPAPTMYTIDFKTDTIEELDYEDAVFQLGRKYHEMRMESRIICSIWKLLIVDKTAWRDSNPDPLDIHYAEPKRSKLALRIESNGSANPGTC